MAGRRILEKKTLSRSDPRVSMIEESFYFYCGTPEWATEPQNSKYLEQTQLDIFEDTDKDYNNVEAANEPWKGQMGRYYFVRNGIVYSVYRCTIRYGLTPHCMQSPFDCAIILISSTDFAAAIIRGGLISHRAEFHHNKGAVAFNGAPKYNAKALHNDIAKVLEKWSSHLKNLQVYVRCSEKQKQLLFEGKSFIGESSSYRLIPFLTSRPSLAEVTKTWIRLTTVVEHGHEKSIMEHVKSNKEKKSDAKFNENETGYLVSPRKLERRAEKQRWPGIDAGQKVRIHNALMNNNYDELREATSQGERWELKDYLSSTHSKLEGQTFMHLAVKLDLCETVEFLLDVDCDPAVVNRKGLVPYQYCKSNEMKKVFKRFRAANPDRHVWTRCHIPEETDVVIEYKKEKKDEEEKKKNEIKERRKQKKAAKKIYID